MERSQVAETRGEPNDVFGETVIEKDNVVLAEAAVGGRGSSVKVLKQNHVLDIHGKYYNK